MLNVTEKVYHALLAGIVPIYIGDSSYFKKLIPFSSAVIYFDDFIGNVELGTIGGKTEVSLHQ